MVPLFALPLVEPGVEADDDMDEVDDESVELMLFDRRFRPVLLLRLGRNT